MDKHTVKLVYPHYIHCERRRNILINNIILIRLFVVGWTLSTLKKTQTKKQTIKQTNKQTNKTSANLGILKSARLGSTSA